MERIMVVPLRKARRGTKEKFASKAVKYLRAFVSRHMKAGSTLIGSNLNEFIWRDGMRNPPRRVEIKSTVKEDVAFIELSSVSNADWKTFLARGK
ncbi:MAG: hypothetical protein GOU98_02495, partial [Candidatus Altiarchaeota archaeon]|nr:hypothetical protein [Candidatus Altiarchaeota archaeon]